ncbi:hydantoinase B/oxoprolinase family protein [Paenibacillus xylaniclasticus]|uniref:hydantoinase B/oxoprolinase family protein n=1 Tax=Paenibacillus xylaniclasticus TaxID=588083 RepID=UPI000FDBD787|nr:MULTISPECIES: hydantoinase B/oxoprolinase family protein [Paenibacillus]GFN30072.1 hypothetical protein PCURB6_03320 [Paenibacillus curdlanolyticus]
MLGSMLTATDSGEKLKQSFAAYYNEFYKNLSCRQMVDPNHVFVAATDLEGNLIYSTSMKNIYNIQSYVETVIKQFPALKSGDTVVTNDPYSGTMHLKDHYMASPFFSAGALAGYIVIGSQLADVGGMVLGNYYPYSKDLFQEGVRTTPLRVSRSGQIDRDVIELQKLNSRLALLLENDLKLMVRISLDLAKVMESYYTPTIAKEWTSESDASIAKLLGQITEPSGTITKTIKNICGEEVEISLSAEISGDKLTVRFLPADEISVGFIHSTYATTCSAVASALIQMTDCIPNAGVVKHLSVEVEENTLLNCSFLKPVGWSPYSPFEEIKEAMMEYFTRFSVPQKRIYSKSYRPAVVMPGINIL